MKHLIISAMLLTLMNSLMAQQETWITNANLLDPVKKTVQSGMTVVIKGNTITAIHKKKAPPEATVIDATGKYLMPGLTDAHVHFFQSGGLYTRPDIIDLRHVYPYEKEIKWVHDQFEDQLRRYLRNGITTVIDVGTSNRFLARRESVNNQSYAPQVYMSGPIISVMKQSFYDTLKDDAPFVWAADSITARKLVRDQVAMKADLIKLYYAIDGEPAEKFLPVIRAAIDEAHKNKLRVAVHATERLAVQLAVEAGIDYLVHSVQEEDLDDATIALIKKNKVLVCPTLNVENGYLHTFDRSRMFTTHELIHASPFALSSLYDLKQFPDTAIANKYKMLAANHVAKSDRINRVSAQNLKKLVDAGVTIVSGSDAGNIGTLHATSLYNELQQMQLAGMNNWQLIQSATINAAGILQLPGFSGNIAVGQPARMILLDADPVADLSNLQKIYRVIQNGQVVNPDTLIHETPEVLVQRQLNAYNTRNMEAFLDTYADDVEMRKQSGTLICKGKEAFKKKYFFFDLAKLLHCRIVKRIVDKNFVVDEEHVIDDRGSFGGTAIYEVKNGKISKVSFLE
ncbi:amidohydrolase family protein [Pseudoflavitalea sp. G-6-1-2]|uniref:amidohydrolase family protein n=1 Tax=Pseudoflavitalea sp. G-6-1-2 TaxID=2728841 RepID=UPI00146B2F72|nr:amidohydrolase family protein [Pseudoflavitalea sp. G-6-1-2]NML19530.1 amidohydrolase family protein [Pseudoflavitalea sp. G-6-1-2]